MVLHEPVLNYVFKTKHAKNEWKAYLARGKPFILLLVLCIKDLCLFSQYDPSQKASSGVNSLRCLPFDNIPLNGI